MDFKQTASIGILLVGIGLFGVESANAKNSATEVPAIASSRDDTQSSSYIIAQLLDANNPIYGSWKLRHSVDGIVHESVLVMNGYSGNMRTRYYHPRLGKQAVDQTIYLKSSPDGLVLLGYNPVYAGTTRKHPYYSADNFLFSIEHDGSAQITNCDDAQRCSAVNVQAIK